MKNRHLLAVLLLTGMSTASAAIVDKLDNLLIDGDYYDVTIHTTGSFEDIWGVPNAAGDFGGDPDDRIVKHAPTFWGSSEAAEVASLAVIGAFGDLDTWSGTSDKVLVPYEYLSEHAEVRVWSDVVSVPNFDYNFASGYSVDLDLPMILGGAYASFEPVSAVPLPAAVWLFGSALAGLSFVTKKRKGVEVS